MAIEIKVPALGESVTEATVGQWFKKPGEAVKVDEPLVELETDKVTVEVPSPVAGVLSDIKVEQGATVGIGSVLGSIKEGAAAAAQPAAPAQAPPPQAKPAEAPSPKPAAAAPAPAASGNGGMPPPPAARKMMEEKGLSAGDVQGSGRRGQVLKDDVAAAAAKPSAARAAPESAALMPMTTAPVPVTQMRAPSVANDAAREERVRMTRLRQTIARRLKDAQNTAAMLTTFNDVDMSADHEAAQRVQGAVREAPSREAGLHGLLREGLHPGAARGAGRQRRDRRPGHHLQELLPHRRGRRHRQGAGGAGGARGRPHVARRDRADHCRLRQAGARGQALDRRDAGRHVHHHQRRRLRLAAVDADPQRAAVGHSRHAPHRGARRRQERPDRGAADDEPGASATTTASSTARTP